MKVERQTKEEIILDLLDAKNSMEKSHDFASKSMLAARAVNPVARLQVLQLHQYIENLQKAKGDARKSAAAGVARSLVAPRKRVLKAVYCEHCGAGLTPDAAFCGNCGARTKATR